MTNIEYFKKIRDGHTKEVIQALKDGFDINTQNPDGNTALHIAVSTYHDELVKILMPFNPSMNIKNTFNYTVNDLITDNNGMQDVIKEINKGKQLLKRKKVGKFKDLLR